MNTSNPNRADHAIPTTGRESRDVRSALSLGATRRAWENLERMDFDGPLPDADKGGEG
jgi:hypothetical protein